MYKSLSLIILISMSLVSSSYSANLRTPSKPGGPASPAVSASNQPPTSGSGTPGGTNGQIQYNNNGSLGGLATVPVSNGGTGSTSLGCGLTNVGGVLNTSQCTGRTVIQSTDTILSTDGGTSITYNSSDPVAVSSSSASSEGFNQGFGVVLSNAGAGTVTWTPTGSTISGRSSLAIPSNSGCYVYSDGTQYQIDFSACTALPISTSNLPTNARVRVVDVTIDGRGSTPSVGNKEFYRVPFSGTISGYSLQSDISGSAVINIWKAHESIPTYSDYITSTTPPTLSNSNYLYSTSLTGWTTSVAVGDVLGFNVDSASTLSRVTLQLLITTD